VAADFLHHNDGRFLRRIHGSEQVEKGFFLAGPIDVTVSTCAVTAYPHIRPISGNRHRSASGVNPALRGRI